MKKLSKNVESYRVSPILFAIAISIIFFLPYIYLLNALENLANQDEAALLVKAKAKLLKESARFQKDLHPSYYIEKKLRANNKHFKIDTYQNENRELTISTGTELITKNFSKIFCKRLKQKYQIIPSLMFSANGSLKNFDIYSSNKNFENKNLTIFGKSYLYYLLESNFDSHFFTYKQHSNERNGFDEFKKRHKIIKPKSYIISTLLSQFHKYITNFAHIFGIANFVKKFFIKKNTPQISYSFILELTCKENNKQNFFGNYFIKIPSLGIFPQNILKYSLQAYDTSIGRTYVKSKSEKKYNINNSSHISYFSAIPSELSELVHLHKKNGLATKDISDIRLKVSIDKNKLKSRYRKIIFHMKSLLKMMLLIFYSWIIFSFTRSRAIQMSLGAKFKICLILLIVIPFIGISTLSDDYSNNVEEQKKLQALQKIQEKFKQFLSYTQTLRLQNNFYYQQLKFILSSNFKHVLSNNYFEQVKKQKTEYGIPRFHGGLEFLTSNGELKRLDSYFSNMQDNNKKLRNLVLLQTIIDLGIADLNSEHMKKLENKRAFIYSITEPITERHASSRKLSNEGINQISIFCTNLERKSCLQYFTGINGKNLVMLAHFFSEDYHLSLSAVNLLQKEKNYSIFQNEGFEIDYGIFLRSKEQLQNDSWPNNGPNYLRLKRLAKMGLKQKKSGSHIYHDDKGLIIEAWQFFHHNSFIFTATARIFKDNHAKFVTETLPLGMLCYSILLIIVFSDFLHHIFLLPIQTLLSGFNLVKNGYFASTIEISSGDEFQNLSFSFNAMTTGLLERERMKRFVSDRLYEELDHTETRAKETEVCLLSSDIRDFTTLTEENSPEDIVTLLNEYFFEMETCIKEFGGSVEKIIGDAILASFYPDIQQKSNHCIRACMAAIKMRKVLECFNTKRQEAKQFKIENGIGIATGFVQLGYIGSNSKRKEFLIIGKPINHSEALEAETKLSKTKILIDFETHQQTKEIIKAISFDKSKYPTWEVISIE